MTAVYAVALICDASGCPAIYPHDTAAAPTARHLAVADGWGCARPDPTMPHVERYVRDYCPQHIPPPTPPQDHQDTEEETWPTTLI